MGLICSAYYYLGRSGSDNSPFTGCRVICIFAAAVGALNGKGISADIDSLATIVQTAEGAFFPTSNNWPHPARYVIQLIVLNGPAAFFLSSFILHPSFLMS